MKTSEFKRIIKETVREAIKEELGEILLEAIKAPKVATPIRENYVTEPIRNSVDPVEQRKKYMDLLGNMATGKDTLNFNTNDLKISGPMDTTSEGSSLPPGEVSLDQIMGLGLKR